MEKIAMVGFLDTQDFENI